MNPLLLWRKSLEDLDIREALSLNKGTVQSIFHQLLQHIKAYAQNQNILFCDHKKRRMSLSLQHLIRFNEDPAFPK